MSDNHFNDRNKHAEKLNTIELKREAYADYCEHIAQGYPQACWSFNKHGILLTSESMEYYFKRYPELCVEGGVFDPIQKEIARAKNYKGWFEVAGESARGENEKANTASLQMIMRNVHGWDKPKDIKNEAKEGIVEGLRAGLRATISSETRARLAKALDEL